MGVWQISMLDMHTPLSLLSPVVLPRRNHSPTYCNFCCPVWLCRALGMGLCGASCCSTSWATATRKWHSKQEQHWQGDDQQGSVQ